MNLNLTDKVAVVTGGGQGIGKGIARTLLNEGMAVLLAELDAEAGQEAAAELAHLGPVHFVRTDVADEPSVAAMIAAAHAHFGRIDGLVNNAGIADSGHTPVEELSLAQWNRVLATNLTGPMLCAKHAVPLLRVNGGAIVNLASTRAFQSDAHTEAYAASKGGIYALTHALAVSLGPEIRVNAIAPGWIETSEWKKQADRRPGQLRLIDHAQHPAGRVGTPYDIGGLTAWLLSGHAGFVTGQTYVIDGGMNVKMHYAE
ncbi:MAG: SDR family oxidoreductase [Caldilineaceae bacterium]|nr:SDR family oxidoreductase [Caldilineaceae bacterium]